jgi:hypothetical protein
VAFNTPVRTLQYLNQQEFMLTVLAKFSDPWSPDRPAGFPPTAQEGNVQSGIATGKTSLTRVQDEGLSKGAPALKAEAISGIV